MASLNVPAPMRRCFRSIVGAMVAVYAGAGPAAPLEQAIKASYVTKFAPFVEWPAAAFAGPGSPFLICLSGRDSFGPVIDDLARGQRVRGRPVQVRRVADAASAGDCQILVIGAGTDGALVEGAGKSMLTISDKSAGVDGGMIRFVRQGGRIRFEIDNGAARAAHLTISSKLLELAVTVNP